MPGVPGGDGAGAGGPAPHTTLWRTSPEYVYPDSHTLRVAKFSAASEAATEKPPQAYDRVAVGSRTAIVEHVESTLAGDFAYVTLQDPLGVEIRQGDFIRFDRMRYARVATDTIRADIVARGAPTDAAISIQGAGITDGFAVEMEFYHGAAGNLARFEISVDEDLPVPGGFLTRSADGETWTYITNAQPTLEELHDFLSAHATSYFSVGNIAGNRNSAVSGTQWDFAGGIDGTAGTTQAVLDGAHPYIEAGHFIFFDVDGYDVSMRRRITAAAVAGNLTTLTFDQATFAFDHDPGGNKVQVHVDKAVGYANSISTVGDGLTRNDVREEIAPFARTSNPSGTVPDARIPAEIMRDAEFTATAVLSLLNLTQQELDDMFVGASIAGGVITFSQADGTAAAITLPDQADGVVTGFAFSADGTTVTVTLSEGDPIVASVPEVLRSSMESSAGVVRYDMAQALSDAQKLQARQNIGADEADDETGLTTTSLWTGTAIIHQSGSEAAIAQVDLSADYRTFDWLVFVGSGEADGNPLDTPKVLGPPLLVSEIPTAEADRIAWIAGHFGPRRSGVWGSNAAGTQLSFKPNGDDAAAQDVPRVLKKVIGVRGSSVTGTGLNEHQKAELDELAADAAGRAFLDALVKTTEETEGARVNGLRVALIEYTGDEPGNVPIGYNDIGLADGYATQNANEFGHIVIATETANLLDGAAEAWAVKIGTNPPAYLHRKDFIQLRDGDVIVFRSIETYAIAAAGTTIQVYRVSAVTAFFALAADSILLARSEPWVQAFSQGQGRTGRTLSLDATNSDVDAAAVANALDVASPFSESTIPATEEATFEVAGQVGDIVQVIFLPNTGQVGGGNVELQNVANIGTVLQAGAFTAAVQRRGTVVSMVAAQAFDRVVIGSASPNGKAVKVAGVRVLGPVGGGSSTLLGLTDVLATTYEGFAGRDLVVNAAETGVIINPTAQQQQSPGGEYTASGTGEIAANLWKQVNAGAAAPAKPADLDIARRYRTAVNKANGYLAGVNAIVVDAAGDADSGIAVGDDIIIGTGVSRDIIEAQAVDRATNTVTLAAATTHPHADDEPVVRAIAWRNADGWAEATPAADATKDAWFFSVSAREQDEGTWDVTTGDPRQAYDGATPLAFTIQRSRNGDDWHTGSQATDNYERVWDAGNSRWIGPYILGGSPQSVVLVNGKLWSGNAQIPATEGQYPAASAFRLADFSSFEFLVHEYRSHANQAEADLAVTMAFPLPKDWLRAFRLEAGGPRRERVAGGTLELFNRNNDVHSFYELRLHERTDARRGTESYLFNLYTTDGGSGSHIWRKLNNAWSRVYASVPEIWTGDYLPSTNQPDGANVGDFYRRTTNNAIYERISTGWIQRISGGGGSSAWHVGSGEPPASLGANTDLYNQIFTTPSTENAVAGAAFFSHQLVYPYYPLGFSIVGNRR